MECSSANGSSSFFLFLSRPRSPGTQGSLSHFDLAVPPEPDEIDRTGIVGRARIIGIDPLVAHARGAIPVSERDILSAGSGKILTTDSPTTEHATRLIAL